MPLLVAWTAVMTVAAVGALVVRARSPRVGLVRAVAGASLVVVLVGLVGSALVTSDAGGSGSAPVPSGTVRPGLQFVPDDQAYSSRLVVDFDPLPGFDERNLVPLRAVRAALSGHDQVVAGDDLGDGGASSLRRHLEVELVTLLPLGVLLPLVRRRRGPVGDLGLVALASLVVSVSLVAVQQLRATGTPVDIDVVLVNVLGAVVLAAVARAVVGGVKLVTSRRAPTPAV